MRTIKVIGLIVAILGLLTAIVALLTEGIKLYRELPTSTPNPPTVTTTPSPGIVEASPTPRVDETETVTQTECPSTPYIPLGSDWSVFQSWRRTSS
jgi:hypothetical protein